MAARPYPSTNGPTNSHNPLCIHACTACRLIEASRGQVREEETKGTSLNSDSLAPKPLASSVYVHVPEAPSPHKRSISIASHFPSASVVEHEDNPVGLKPGGCCASTSGPVDHQVSRQFDQQRNLQRDLDQMNYTSLRSNGPFKGPSSYHRFCCWWLICARKSAYAFGQGEGSIPCIMVSQINFGGRRNHEQSRHF